ncbi:MAG: hypothetical protein VX265_07565 [Myxococcota bacterium]|nr:hypothetical protein [Myxococcota bacterium]
MTATLPLLLGLASATPRAVGVGGGPIPADGVVRVAFEGVPVSRVTVKDGEGEERSLLESRCTTAKAGETELCVFRLPDDVPDGVLALEADALSTTVEVADAADPGTWSGTVQQRSATVSQRDDPSLGERVMDVDSAWDAPAAPAAGYILEIRDETDRPVDWRTIPVDGASTLLVATATEVLVSSGELCLQPAVFNPYDEEVWVGNRICEDMPDPSDPACRGCATGTAGPTGLLAGLALLSLVRRRR